MYIRLLEVNRLKFSSLFKKRDDGAIEFRRNMAITDANNDKTGQESDYINTMGKMGYLLYDETVTTFLFENKPLQPLLPVLSPLNSTTNLSKFDAELKCIRMDNFFTMMKLTMNPADYENRGLEFLDGLRLFAMDRVSDARDGWKGHISTEVTKRLSVVEEKKKGLLG